MINFNNRTEHYKTSFILRKLTISSLIVLLYIPLALVSNSPIGKNDDTRAKNLLKKTSLYFEENKGQFFNESASENILFKAPCKNSDIYITTKGITYVFYKKNVTSSDTSQTETSKTIKWEFSKVNMNLKEAHISKENIITENPISADINYYTANHPNGIKHVKRFKKVLIKKIYPSIDWVIYTDGEAGFKYDFIVHPGADLSLIQLQYEGADKLELAEEGKQILINTSLGKIKEGDLVTYESNPSNKVFSSYILKNNDVSFFVPKYDRSKCLIIDPPVLSWATFFGGTPTDEIAFSATTDKFGHLWITGEANNTPAGLPTLNPGGTVYFQGTTDGADGFISKFDVNGSLIWSTYFGGSSGDRGEHICSDSNGNIYITGYTFSNDFPIKILPGAYNQSSNGGSRDGFISKFDNTGSLIWSTYFGGSSEEFPRAITTDNAGNVFCTGRVNSVNMPLQNPGGGAYYQATYAGGNRDAFIWKFSATGVLNWSTYYGGSGWDEGYALTIDTTNNLWITGYENSSNLPLFNLTGAYNQAAIGGSYDALILKFSNSGAQLWATHFGGIGYDAFYDITVDKNNNIWLTGNTASSDFPTQNPGSGAYFQGTLGNTNGNASILKLSNNGTIIWSTFYGGTNASFFSDKAYGIIVDDQNDVWVTGHCTSTDFPVSSCGGFFQGNNKGNNGDGFLLHFKNSGLRKWGSYYGSWSQDNVWSIAYSAPNNIFITGSTNGINPDLSLVNPSGGAYYQGTLSGGSDAFIAKFQKLPIVTGLDTIICNGESTSLTVTGGGTYEWSTLQTTASITVSPVINTTYSVVVTNGLCKDTAYIHVTVQNSSTTITNVNNDTICNGGSVAINPLGASNYTLNPGNITGTSFTVNPITTTTYTVNTIDSNGCIGSPSSHTTFVITVNQLPILSVDSITHVSCFGLTNGNVSFVASGGSGSGYIITPNSTTNLAAGTYTFSVTDGNNCQSSKQITINESLTLCDGVLIPNIVTANGDGVNDVFKIKNLEFHPNTKVTIYDRWGKKVYENSNYQNDWKAENVSDGTFFYIIDIPDDKKHDGFLTIFHGK